MNTTKTLELVPWASDDLKQFTGTCPRCKEQSLTRYTINDKREYCANTFCDYGAINPDTNLPY